MIYVTVFLFQNKYYVFVGKDTDVINVWNSIEAAERYYERLSKLKPAFKKFKHLLSPSICKTELWYLKQVLCPGKYKIMGIANVSGQLICADGQALYESGSIV